jgi:hypothetical protein
MNLAEYEVYEAIKVAQKEPEIIRCICLTCKGYISDWDAQKGYAVCRRCRRACWPAPKVERYSEPRKPTLIQLRDG